MQIKLNELTLDNLGTWPTLVKAVVAAIVFILVVFFGYWLDTMGQLGELATTRNQQETLLETITIKQAQAANLNSYKQQLYQIDSIFNELLRRLPTSSEVPRLLDDISKTGIANGLTFVLFKPEPETKKGFNAELPIQISVIGSYHQLGQFISDIEGLDRIVTLHDFTIKPVSAEDLTNLGKKKAEPGQLVLTITARTYRYVEKGVVDTSSMEKK